MRSLCSEEGPTRDGTTIVPWPHPRVSVADTRRRRSPSLGGDDCASPPPKPTTNGRAPSTAIERRPTWRRGTLLFCLISFSFPTQRDSDLGLVSDTCAPNTLPHTAHSTHVESLAFLKVVCTSRLSRHPRATLASSRRDTRMFSYAESYYCREGRKSRHGPPVRETFSAEGAFPPQKCRHEIKRGGELPRRKRKRLSSPRRAAAGRTLHAG